jgi:hypothetical protein
MNCLPPQTAYRHVVMAVVRAYERERRFLRDWPQFNSHESPFS